MRTGHRLNQSYRGARVEWFDDRARFVFMSDTHRGDGSLSDEFTRNESIFLYALNHYHHEGFTFVEVGDGDEIWERFQFRKIHFAHSEVFDALRLFHEEDRLIMLYGNHNIQYRNHEYVRRHLQYVYDPYEDRYEPLFPDLEVYESLLLKYRPTGQEILVVHGHQGDLMNDYLWLISMMFLRYLWRFMHVMGFKNPTSPARSITKTHKIEKAFSRWIVRTRMMLICGHTHMRKFPARGHLPYFNTGCGILRTGVTAIEIDVGQITMVEWKIRAERDGVLRMARQVIHGPEPLTRFQFDEFFDVDPELVHDDFGQI